MSRSVSNSTPRRSRQSTSSSIAPATTPDVVRSHSPLNPSDLTAAINRKTLSNPLQQHDREQEDEDDDTMMLRWGWGMLIGSSAAFILGIWSIAIGPFIDTSGIPVLNAMANDKHYKYILVFLVPVTLYAVIINWWGLKIFRHAWCWTKLWSNKVGCRPSITPSSLRRGISSSQRTFRLVTSFGRLSQGRARLAATKISRTPSSTKKNAFSKRW